MDKNGTVQRTRLIHLISAATLLAVAGCGRDAQHPASMVSPDLDCDGARIGRFEPDLDPETSGAQTADAAIDEVLLGWAANFDAEVVALRPGAKAMFVDGRNVVVVFAREAPAGGYWADRTDYCLPFMIEGDLAVPATAPDVTADEFRACEPVPRFRVGDIEYENRQFDDVVAVSDLGPVVAEIRVRPAAFERCEVVVLADGEGSWPAGTNIHQIVGVDPAKALAASLGADVYLVFYGRVVAG